MPWPRAAQRVLITLAAALLVLAAYLGREATLRPVAVSVPDDQALDVRLDLNRATTADLETLPGVGAALAGRVVSHRSSRGPFRSVDELRQVPGFGEKLVTTIDQFVTVR